MINKIFLEGNIKKKCIFDAKNFVMIKKYFLND